MANNEKGLDRGGVLGQEGELEGKDLDKQFTERAPSDRRNRERVTPERRKGAGQMDQQPGGLQREPDLQGAEKKTGHGVD